MKHIKLYEEYEDLLGDLQDIGIHPIDFKAQFGNESWKKKEEEFSKSWKSEIDPKIHIRKVEGSIGQGDDHDWIGITLSNNDYLEYNYTFDRRSGDSQFKFAIDGIEYPEHAGEIHDEVYSGRVYTETMTKIYDKEKFKYWS